MTFSAIQKASSNPVINSNLKALNFFKSTYPDIAIIHRPFTLLHETFCNPVRLKCNREIYPIYEALTIISAEVVKKNYTYNHIRLEKCFELFRKSKNCAYWRR